jgi:hypothetical protein
MKPQGVIMNSTPCPQCLPEGCRHEKVYANYVLTSLPPQYPWICKLCGLTGVDAGASYKANEYDELVKRFHPGEVALKVSSE